MKLITQIKLIPSYKEQDLINAICKKTKTTSNDIINYEIIKLGIDARKKPDVYIVLNVAVNFKNYCLKKLKNFEDINPDHMGLSYEKKENNLTPVVVGFGPSGMFCALALSLAGYKPIVLEQGKCVEDREKDIKDFGEKRILNEHSNIQFGEGGAGTFSDGKLNTTLNNEYCKKVINELILNGAPKEIYYKNKAHIGTDNLKIVVKNIREKIIKNGGKIIFNAKFNDFSIKNGQISSIFYKDLLNNKQIEIKTNTLVLAIGHSAIDVYTLCKNKNILMNKKPFAVGVRIEHPQKLINFSQYGVENPKGLPSADYKLVEHLPNGRSVFTFCMCPGGQVVASSSETGTIVTNGMSEFKRDKEFANSALLVNVSPDDFENDDVLAGLAFQRKYEKLAYEIAGKNYNAPCQTVGSFLNNQYSNNNSEINSHMNICSYLPSVTMCDISKCLPDFVTESLKQALPLFNKKINGFANENSLLIAPETRSSSPVQFARENYVCTFKGLYACGEGSGYAGGIVSSAADGIKCAEAIINN